MVSMFTISELADLAAVTPRAIRHYHRLGVLPEPPRRGNGYRSYGPVDLVRLVHVRRMQDLGLSLAEISGLADDQPADTRSTLLALDEDLARQQRELSRRRAAIAAVLDGPADLTLPPELAVLLDRAAALGLPAAALATEREALALLVALHPERTPMLTRMYAGALGDEALVTLGVRFATLDGPPDDPAVEELAGELAAVLRGHTVPGAEPQEWRFDVMGAYLRDAMNPAQQRCAELIGKEFG